jgi:PKD repeat protein
MNFVIQLIIQIIIAIVVAELTAKKPTTNLKAKNLDAFNFPTVSTDRAIPYVCGDVLVSAPNVTWYGDLVVTTLTKKVKSGLFSSSRVPVGFEYRLGMELALAWGDIDKITEIYFGREQAFSGEVLGSNGGTSFTVDAPGIFGGRENGGGVYADCVFYPGYKTQTADSYMTAHVGEAYRHQGLAKLVWKGPNGNLALFSGGQSGLLGESENIQAIKVRMTRLPNKLGSNFKDINGTANPAEVIFEILTGTHINLPGLPTAPYLESSDFDIPNFLEAAEAFFNEGMGISFQWQQDSIIDDIIKDIEEHTQCNLVEDPVTGLLQLVLLRDDYDLDLVPSFDEDTIVGFNNFSTNAEDTLTNEIIATYTKLGELSKPEPIAIQNSGNLYAQENISTMNLDLTMFTSPEVAQKRAFLELQIVSNPLRSGQAVLDRSAWGLKIGSVVKLNYDEYDIVNMAARITGIEYGSLLKRQIIITFVEDVFSLGDNIFPNPVDSQWIDPNSLPASISESNIFEIPKRLLNTANPNQVGMMPTRPTGTVYSYDVHISLDGSVTFNPLLEGLAFAEAGQLTAAIAQDTEYLLANGATFEKSEYFTHSNNANVPDETFQNFIFIGFELFVYDYLIDNLDGTFTTNELHRALLDTLPSAHSIGDLVIPLEEIIYLDTEFADNLSMAFKLLTYSWAGKLGIDDAPNIDYTVINREQLPYPPADLQINGLQTIPPIFSGDTTITWKDRDRTNTGLFKQGDAEDSIESGAVTVIEIRKTDDTIMRTFDPANSPLVYTLDDELTDFGFYQSQIKIVAYTKNEADENSLYQWEKTINKEAPNTPPSAGFSFVANDREITFSDLSIDADGTVDSWLWDFGDTNTSTDQNPVHTYDTNGTYNVTLIVTDDDGDTGQIIKSVEATDINKIPVADFSYAPVGTVVTFTDLSTDSDGTVASWVWDFGDTNTSTDQNPVHDYGITGVFLVTLTVTDNEGGVSIVKTKSIAVGVDTIPVLNLPGTDTTLNKIDLVGAKAFVPQRVSTYPALGGDGWGGAIDGANGVGEDLNGIQAGSLDLTAYKWSTDSAERGNIYETVEIPTNDDIKQIITTDGSVSWTFEIWLAKSPFSFEIIDTATNDFALSISHTGTQFRVYAGGTGGSQSYRSIYAFDITSLVIVYDANIPSLTFYKDGVAETGTIEDNTNSLIIPAPLGVNEYKLRLSSNTHGSSVANMKLSLGAKGSSEIASDFASDSAGLEGEVITNVKSLTGFAITDSAADDSVGVTAGFIIEPSVYSQTHAAFKALIGSTTPLDDTERMITHLEGNIVKVVQISGDPLQGSELNVDHIITAGDPPLFYLSKASLTGSGTLTATVQIVVNINGVDYIGDNIVLTCTHVAAVTPPTFVATANLDEAIADSSPSYHFKFDEISGTLYGDIPNTSFMSATTDIAAANHNSLRFDAVGRSGTVLNNSSSINSLQGLANTMGDLSAEFGLLVENTIIAGRVHYVCEIGDKFVVNNETARGAISVYIMTDRVFLRIFYLDGGVPQRKTVFAYKTYGDNVARWYSVRKNGSEVSLFVDGELILTVDQPSGTNMGSDTSGVITLLNTVYQADIDDFVYYNHAIHGDIIDRNSQYFLTGSYTP